MHACNALFQDRFLGHQCTALQAFFKKYDYKHEVLCVAADGPSNVSFSFVADTVSVPQPRSPVQLLAPCAAGDPWRSTV